MTAYQKTTEELVKNPKKWLVTGAAGFIGSNLVLRLLELNQHVVGIDNFSTGKRQNIKELLDSANASRFQFHEADITDLKTCQSSCHGADYILHQAAVGSVPRSIDDPATTHNANVTGTLNMLLAAKEAQVHRFVYASSSSVYGDHPALPKIEDQIGDPLSPYACSKLFCEHYAQQFGMHYKMATVGLRYFNVFGPRQDPGGAYAAVIPKWIAALIQNETVYINGDGSFSRDFCYIENVIQANILAATVQNPEAINQAYNIACGDRTDLNSLYRILHAALKPQFPHLEAAQPHHRDNRPGDVPHSLASIDKAKRLLGYEPQFQMEEGMTHALKWYIENLR